MEQTLKVKEKATIRELNLEISDLIKFGCFLEKLDNQTDFLLYESGERNTSIEYLTNYYKNLRNSNSKVFVCEYKNEIIAFISGIRRKPKRVSHIIYIVTGVLEDYRGKGIGNKLFKKIFSWSSKAKISRIELKVREDNNIAIKLYEKLGFEKEGIRNKAVKFKGKFYDEIYMSKII